MERPFSAQMTPRPTKEAWAPATPCQISLDALIEEFKALQESESIARARRDRWMQLAEAYVNSDSIYMQQTLVLPLEASKPSLHVSISKQKNFYSANDGFVLPPRRLSSTFDLRDKDSVPTSVRPSVGSSSKIEQNLSRLYNAEDQSRIGFLRKHIWFILEDPDFRCWAKWVHWCYAIIIALSVVATVMSTLEHLEEWLVLLLTNIDYGFNALFTLEVFVRLITAPSIWLNLKSMYFWMDVGAVVPFYIRVITGLSPAQDALIELIGLLIPILRLLKITRHSNGWRLLIIAMRKCVRPLLVPLFFLTLLTVLFSCVIFWIEKHTACKPDPAMVEDPLCPPKAQRAFLSIPHTMWFALVTMSTVGYGDVYPNTNEGKIASSLLILVGVCYLSMPLTIVGSTFWTVWENKDVILIQEKTKERFRHLTKEGVRRIFELADEDGSGTVTRHEFISLCQVLEVGMNASEIANMYKSIDMDRSGDIVFEEFLNFLFPEIAAQAEKDELLKRQATISLRTA